jgi:hypothetical protein
VLNAQGSAKVDFQRDVQPILKANCIGCHGPAQQKNNFRLDRRRDAMRGGTIAMIAPGSSESSHLYLRLISRDKIGMPMPPPGLCPRRRSRPSRTGLTRERNGPMRHREKHLLRRPIPKLRG